MWGKCNDNFHHAVYAGEGPARFGGEGAEGGGDNRISLFLKRYVRRDNGVRGHNLRKRFGGKNRGTGRASATASARTPQSRSASAESDYYSDSEGGVGIGVDRGGEDNRTLRTTATQQIRMR